VSASLFRSDQGYPILKTDERGKVWGEIYGLPDSDFNELDRLEGVPHLFQRVKTEVAGKAAWIYIAGNLLKNQSLEPIDSYSWLSTCYDNDPAGALRVGIALEHRQRVRSKIHPPPEADNFIWMPGNSPLVLVVFPREARTSSTESRKSTSPPFRLDQNQKTSTEDKELPTTDSPGSLAVAVAVHCAYGAHLCYVPWERGADRKLLVARLDEVLRRMKPAALVELESDFSDIAFCLDVGPLPEMPWLCGNMRVLEIFHAAGVLFGLPEARIEHSARSTLIEQLATRFQIPAIRLSLCGTVNRPSEPLSALLPLVQSLGGLTKHFY
jgi:gamma-glutamylcyclotransferase (GGCT)/AIG2-like uncharacterized protein YtfP